MSILSTYTQERKIAYCFIWNKHDTYLGDFEGPSVNLEGHADDRPWHLFYPGRGTDSNSYNCVVFNIDSNKRFHIFLIITMSALVHWSMYEPICLCLVWQINFRISVEIICCQAVWFLILIFPKELRNLQQIPLPLWMLVFSIVKSDFTYNGFYIPSQCRHLTMMILRIRSLPDVKRIVFPFWTY